MHVVATAGHVDHGKSSLVRALTGTDPDRLEEERRRGLTIELGYAWTQLPGAGEVAFVDVPGHERFLATTLAGVGPVPVAMLVVAADDPWMPQAAEHLAALDALGTRHGLVVVSRSDLADPAATLARAREEVDRTTLAGAPAVAVSAHTGAGLGELRRTLAEVLAGVPRPDAAGVRLWVDRRFHIRGAGTVVTGTLASGAVSPGDLLATPDGSTVRVRGVEALGRQRDRVEAPARVALDLGGRAPETIARGVPLLTPGTFHATTVVDVALTAVTGSGRLPERPNLHLGSVQLNVHARPLDDVFCRLTLPATVPLRHGDRAILRDPGDRSLWGVRVVDPMPPPLTRRGAASARAVALAALDGSLAADLALRGPARASDLARIGLTGPPPAGVLAVGDWLVPSPEPLRDRLLAAVQAGPEGGLSPAEAARALDLPDPALVEALVTPPLVYAGGRVRVAAAGLPAELAGPLARLGEQLREAPFAAPTADELAEAGLDAATVARLHRDGHVLRLAPGVVVLPDAAGRAVELLGGLPQPFTTSQARQALGTSRRVVLPLLAHLDATGRTLRLPDDTRRVRDSARGPA
jgi:selenocysteine-specific elongation factor